MVLRLDMGVDFFDWIVGPIGPNARYHDRRIGGSYCRRLAGMVTGLGIGF